MTVSFTGINNIKILKSQKQGQGTFINAHRELAQGDLNLTEIKLRFNLTNDAEGNDMDNLKNALKEAQRGYSYDTQKPDLVELHLKHTAANDGVIPVSQSVLLLNGQNINITKREDLGLYTYLAALTRKIGARPDLSEKQKECTKMMNEAIHENAVDYIDNVM